MNHEALIDWLLENGGPAIRYRTASELMPHSSNVDIAELRQKLLRSNSVRTWLNRFVPFSIFNDIHGSKATTFENVVGKLTDLGLKRGIAEFDQQIIPFCKWLEENSDRPPTHIFDWFARTLIAAFLARSGYGNESAVGQVLKTRLDTIYNFTRKQRFDIYVSPEGYPQIPSSFKNRPLINPELSIDGNLCLPWIYDIFGFAAYLAEHGNEDDLMKADTIINYILNKQYQRLPEGYGILIGDNRRYYAMGWSVHLPGFIDKPSEDVNIQHLQPWILGAFIQRLCLLGQFPIARHHPWFINSLKHLEGFQTEKGTYLFPRLYLPEKANGIWVIGARTGLEENRKTNLAIELESTFWMVKLHTLSAT